MKDIKPKSLIFAFSLILLLVFSSFGSFGTSIDIFKNDNPVSETNFNFKTSIIPKKLNFQSIKTSAVTIKENQINRLDFDSFNDSENIVVVNTSANESYPSMVLNGRFGLVAYEHEDNDNTYIYLRQSKDYGQNWPEGIELHFELENSEISVNSPSLCIEPMDELAYGAFLSPVRNSGTIGNIEIPDISDFNESILYFIVDWSEYGFWNFSQSDIVYHSNENAPWITNFIGTTNYSDVSGDWSANNSLMFFYQDDFNPSQVVIQWDPELENCSNLSLAMDNASKNFYGICEIDNVTNQDLLFFSGFYDHENNNPFLNLTYQLFTGSQDLRHPKIFIKDEDIYIVTEIKDNETHDIIIFHSSNEGKNWKIIDPTGSSVPPPDFFPKYPLISANKTDILCIYTEDNNLSLTTSNNSGVNWSNPAQLNNVNSSVVEEYRFADMPDNKHIIWTDKREGNYDLYSVSQGAPNLNLMIVPGSLDIKATDISFLSTKSLVVFKVKNNGGDYAEDVKIEVIINRTNKDPILTDYPGFIKYLEIGAEKSFEEPLFSMTLKGYINSVSDLESIDFITVCIIPSETFPDSDPSDNSESITVSFEEIFPELYQRPILLTIIKILAQIL